MSRAVDEEGVVLLIVLGVIVLLTGSVFAFARTSLLEIRSQVHRSDRLRAELLARSGLELGIRALQDDGSGQDGPLAALETTHDAWQLLSQQPIPVPGDGELRVTVRDSGNRLNLNGLVDAEGNLHGESRAFLLAALERIIELLPGRREDKLYDRQALADAILDWLDSDDVTRLGDAEGRYYEQEQALAPPANRPLVSIEELSDLPEIDTILLDGLRAYFTVHPMFAELENSGVNPNTAPPHVLSLIFQGPSGDKRLLDDDDVFRILRVRREGRIFCPGAGREPCESFASEIGRIGETVFPPLSYSSDVFTIRSEARFGDARSCVEMVLDRETLPQRTLFSYRLDC